MMWKFQDKIRWCKMKKIQKMIVMAMLIMETMSWDVEFMATNKERDFGLLRELVNFLSCDQSASDGSNSEQN